VDIRDGAHGGQRQDRGSEGAPGCNRGTHLWRRGAKRRVRASPPGNALPEIVWESNAANPLMRSARPRAQTCCPLVRAPAAPHGRPLWRRRERKTQGLSPDETYDLWSDVLVPEWPPSSKTEGAVRSPRATGSHTTRHGLMLRAVAAGLPGYWPQASLSISLWREEREMNI
jgi:hypothetical protein